MTLFNLFVIALIGGLGFEIGRHGVRGVVAGVVAAYKKIFKKS